MVKVIEITVRVLNIEADDKYGEDSNYEPERICLSYEEDDYEDDFADYVYAEADDIKACIERLVTS